jgi:hypothetical protein
VALALRLATLAASLSVVCGPAFAAAAAVALVTDLRGEARVAGGPQVAFLSELNPDARLMLEPSARITLIYVESGTEFTLSGPGEFVIEATQVRNSSGSPPSRRTVVARPDPVTVSRLADSATASVRMRSVTAPQATSARPELLYPRARIAVLQPTLAWSADIPPGGFTVLVTAADGKPAWRGTAKATNLKVGAKLAPASRYTWSLMHGDTLLGEASFETLPAESVRRAEAARAASRTFSDRVLHALVLQELGAAQDARLAWAALSRERPELPELAVLAR